MRRSRGKELFSCCICAWDDEYGASGASDGKESDSKFCWNSFEVGAEKLRSDGRLGLAVEVEFFEFFE